ncbi:MAG: hypothetical protein WC905_01425 [Patescibacteria group bacterium]|jgi:hypothetical protein
MVTRAIRNKVKAAKEGNVERILDRILVISKIIEKKKIFDYISDEKARKDKEIDLAIKAIGIRKGDIQVLRYIAWFVFVAIGVITGFLVKGGL